MKTCLCIKPDLHEVEGFAKCKVCDQWFNSGVWKEYWKGKVESAIDRDSIGRNDPCPCQSGKKYKKCCIPVTPYRRWIKKNPIPEKLKGKTEEELKQITEDDENAKAKTI